MADAKVYRPSMLAVIPGMFGTALLSLFIWFQIGTEGSWTFGRIFAIIFFIGMTIFHILTIKMTTYELSEDGISIKKGIIMKSQTVLLYSQIQDVDEYQDFLSRLIGLKALQLQTMTVTSAMAGSLRSLTAHESAELKSHIIERINERTMKTSKRPSAKNIQEDLTLQEDATKANPYPPHFLKLGVVWFVLLLVVSIAIVILTFQLGEPALKDILPLIVVLVALPFLPIVISSFLQYTRKYWLGEHTVALKKGLFSLQRTNIEYGKLQDFIINRNILARMLGLASVKLETGAFTLLQNSKQQQQENSTIPLVAEQDAQRLTTFLLDKMDVAYTTSKTPLVAMIPLDWKKPLKKTSGVALGFGLFLCLAAAFLVLLGYLEGSGTPSAAMMGAVIGTIALPLIVITLCVFAYQQLYLKRYFYDCSKDVLTIKKGVIDDAQIYLPFEKIQNVYMDQDLFDRVFGIYDVHVSTVGRGSFAMCHIDGLDRQNAEKMVELLKRQIKQNIKK